MCIRDRPRAEAKATQSIPATSKERQERRSAGNSTDITDHQTRTHQHKENEEKINL